MKVSCICQPYHLETSFLPPNAIIILQYTLKCPLSVCPLSFVGMSFVLCPYVFCPLSVFPLDVSAMPRTPPGWIRKQCMWNADFPPVTNRSEDNFKKQYTAVEILFASELKLNNDFSFIVHSLFLCFTLYTYINIYVYICFMGGHFFFKVLSLIYLQQQKVILLLLYWLYF